MIKAVVGANWGDEGKGKITDVKAAESDIVVRFQGGSNAGLSLEALGEPDAGPEHKPLLRKEQAALHHPTVDLPTQGQRPDRICHRRGMNPVHQHPTFAAAAHRLPHASAAGKSEAECFSLLGEIHAAALQQSCQLLTALRWEIKVLFHRLSLLSAGKPRRVKGSAS